MYMIKMLLYGLRAMCNKHGKEVIYLLLTYGPQCQKELIEEIGFSQPAASNCIKLLIDHGLVNEEKVGRNVYYSLNHERYNDLQNFAKKMYQKSNIIQEDEVIFK